MAMALRSSIVKKVPLFAVMRGTRVVVGGSLSRAAAVAVRRLFCSGLESNKTMTIAADCDWSCFAYGIDYVAQRVEKIEQQVQELLSQRPQPPYRAVYHDPELPKFYAVAQQVVDSYNETEMFKELKLELVKVSMAYTTRDKTVVVIRARTCNTRGGRPLFFKGIVSFEDETMELIPLVPSNLEGNEKTTIAADYDGSRVADRIDYVAQRVEKIEHQLQEQLSQGPQPQPYKGQALNSILDRWKSMGNDDLGGCNINYIPPVYHDPELPKFYAVAQWAIDSYNLSQQALKLELVKVSVVYTSREDDKTVVAIRARTCNTPNRQPFIFEGIVSFEDEKLEELIPLGPST